MTIRGALGSGHKANAELKTLNGRLTTDLAAFNKLKRDANIPAVKADEVEQVLDFLDLPAQASSLRHTEV
jgi:hypothetical protein